MREDSGDSEAGEAPAELLNHLMDLMLSPATSTSNSYEPSKANASELGGIGKWKITRKTGPSAQPKKASQVFCSESLAFLSVGLHPCLPVTRLLVKRHSALETHKAVIGFSEITDRKSVV